MLAAQFRKGEIMARLLLLASLVISAFGCVSFDNLHESTDKKWVDGAGQPIVQEVELCDGGPKKFDKRLMVGPTKIGSLSSAQQEIRLRIMVAEVERPDISVLGIGVGNKERDDSTKLPWVVDNGVGEVAIKPMLKKLGKILAEHTLTIKNGQEATWQSGGSFEPVRYVGYMYIAVSSIPFGVQMDLTPTIIDGNRIRLELVAAI